MLTQKKIKKINHLKAKTRRKVSVLLAAYHSVTVIPNETLNCHIMLFRSTQSWLQWLERWLAMISWKDFTPTASHRVCSLHFAGGKKT